MLSVRLDGFFFFFQKPNNTFDSKLYLMIFVAEPKLTLVFADQFTQLCSKLFPDSKYVSKFADKHMNCTQIIKRATTTSLENKVVQMCQNQTFSILCDESIDRGADKCLYPFG